MNIARVQEIKELIDKTEIESAKSQGIIDNIKKQWKEKFGTDDIEKVKLQLGEMKSELEVSNKRLKTLEEKLESSYDWNKLEQELGF